VLFLLATLYRLGIDPTSRHSLLVVAPSSLVANIMGDLLENFCDDLSGDVPEGGTAKAKRFDNSVGDFWPEQFLTDRITADIVRRVFYEADPDYDPTLVTFAVDEAKKLFAITANIPSPPNLLLARMQFFKSTGITDSTLAAEIETSNSSGTASLDNNSTSFADRLVSPNPKLWRPTAIVNFRDNLWKAVAPVFSTSRSNYDFKTNTILPFGELNANIKGGAFSTVHKVAIYKGYYKDADVPVSGFLMILPEDQGQY
jgi:hypothetical protein